MRREKTAGAAKRRRLFSMLLAVCLMIAALPLSVSAAGEYVPGNPRWSGYQNQVQWDRPAGAASGDSFEYEAQLLLGDDVVESKAVEIDTYLFFHKRCGDAAAGGVHHTGACQKETEA